MNILITSNNISDMIFGHLANEAPNQISYQPDFAALSALASAQEGKNVSGPKFLLTEFRLEGPWLQHRPPAPRPGRREEEGRGLLHSHKASRTVP